MDVRCFLGLPDSPHGGHFLPAGGGSGEVAGDKARQWPPARPGASRPSSPDCLLWPRWERLRPHSERRRGTAVGVGGGEPRVAVLTHVNLRTELRTCSRPPRHVGVSAGGREPPARVCRLSLGTRRPPTPPSPYLRRHSKVRSDSLPTISVAPGDGNGGFHGIGRQPPAACGFLP